MPAAVVAVRGEDELFTIGAKHGESIKALVTAYLFQPCTVKVYQVHIKRKAALILMVTAKNNMLAVRCKVRRPVGIA